MDTAIRQNNIASRHVPCIYLQFHMYPICACALHHCMCLTSMHNALHVCTCITSMYCALSKGMCLAPICFFLQSTHVYCICAYALHLCKHCIHAYALHLSLSLASMHVYCIYAFALHL